MHIHIYAYIYTYVSKLSVVTRRKYAKYNLYSNLIQKELLIKLLVLKVVALSFPFIYIWILSVAIAKFRQLVNLIKREAYYSTFLHNTFQYHKCLIQI